MPTFAENRQARFRYEIMETLEAGLELAGYDPMRWRKLLLTKSEITTLAGIEAKKGLTIIPLRVYSKGRSIKLAIGVARGRKGHDKREHLKRREIDREIRRTLKTEF